MTTTTTDYRHGVTLTAYRHGCRCEPCSDLNRRVKREYRQGKRAGSLDPHRSRRPSDGIVDWVVVDQLIAGTASWTDATMEEAIAAAHAARRGDGWYAWCAETLHLRHDVIAGIAAERRAG